MQEEENKTTEEATEATAENAEATEAATEEQVAPEAAPEAAAAEEKPAEQPEEPAKEEAPKAEEPKKPAREVSPKLEDIIKSIETMTVLELADLVKALEERFGVTAAAPMAMAAAPAAGAGAEAVEEQSSFTVVLASAGANKIGAIKAVREIVPTLGLKEAKDLVDGAPKTVVEGVGKEAANEAKAKLEAAGATVELK